MSARLVWLLTAIAVVLCGAFALISWNAAFVHYALPVPPGSSVSEDHTQILGGRIAVAILDVVLAVVAAGAGWRTARVARPTAMVLTVTAVVAAAVVSLLVLSQPTPVY